MVNYNVMERVNRNMTIKSIITIASIAVALFCSSLAANSSSSAYESTPAEQDDVKSVNQVNQDNDNVYTKSPSEQDGVKSIEQLDKDTDNVYNATPAERADVTPIDKVND